MKLKGILEQIVGHEIDEFTYKSRIDEWNAWYAGHVKSFHEYRQYNGKKNIKRERASMQMAKRVCEDWANLLINEKTDIVISDDNNGKSTDELARLLYDLKFWVTANQGVEKAFALSMGAFVVRVSVSVDEDGNDFGDGDLHISFIPATKMYPLEYDEDNKITECAFISRIRKNRYRVAVHHLNERGNYVIDNCEADGRTEDNMSIDEATWFQFDTRSPLPWFTVLYPNIANNIDVNSPYGISIFANSIDKLKTCDETFDSLRNEFSLGKKRIFVNAKMLALDENTGEYRDVFDPNDVAFYTLPEGEEGDNPLLSDSTQQLRIHEHVEGIQTALNALSDGCGFGTEHYKFDGVNVSTATQVVSENSDMFRTMKKHEIVIEDCLKTLTRAILYASATFCGKVIAPVDAEITIKFDDSIIVDKQTEKASDRYDVDLGVMSKASYRAKWYGEDEETAQEKIDEIQQTALESMIAASQAANEGGGEE